MAMPPSRAASNAIIGGILLHLSLGTLYSWGCIQPYVTSYIRLYDASVTTKDTTIIYACAALGHALVAPFVGPLQFRLGLRGCAAFGASLVALATLASAATTTVVGLSVLSSIFGIGIAIAYTCPLVCGYALMPDRKGRVSGFIVAGFGAGAAVFDGVATACVNPGDLAPDPGTGYYDEDVAGRVPRMYLVLGTCYFLLGMVGSWMLTPLHLTTSVAPATLGEYASLVSGRSTPTNGSDNGSNEDTTIVGYLAPIHEKGFAVNVPESPGPRADVSVFMEALPAGGEDGDRSVVPTTLSPVLPPTGASVSTEERAYVESRSSVDGDVGVEGDVNVYECDMAHGREAGGSPAKQRQFDVWDLLNEGDFYYLTLCMMLTSVSGLFIAGSYKRIAEQSFPDADRFLSVLGSVASLFNASGRVIGGLAVDRFGCFATLLVMASSMTGALLVLSVAQASRVYFFAVVCLVHMLYGTNFAIYPTLTAEFFGVAAAGPNYGLVFMGYGVGSFFGMLWLSGVTSSVKLLLSCAGLSFVGFVSVMLLWVRRSRPSQRQKG